jgi:hypothetical protein
MILIKPHKIIKKKMEAKKVIKLKKELKKDL